jgi:SecD/SecF fusion protein
MERQKRWQLYLIIAVLILTVYNILPTIFYYSRPLTSFVDENRANQIALSIADRTNQLEDDTVDWLDSFSGQLKLNPLSISIDKAHPEYVTVAFKTTEEANKLREYLPRAGALIPFAPSQLSLSESPGAEATRTVLIKRRIPIHLDPQELNAFYQFSPKFNEQGKITDLYRALINDRALQLGVTLGGPSENGTLLNAVLKTQNHSQSQEILYSLSQDILSFVKIFGETSSVSQRYFASFSQIDSDQRSKMGEGLVNAMNHLKDTLRLEKIALQEESQKQQAEGSFLSTQKAQRLEILTAREKTLESAQEIVKRHVHAFSSGKSPFSFITFGAAIHESGLKHLSEPDALQMISLSDRNPFIQNIAIDWRNEKIYLDLQPDLLLLKQKAEESENLSQYRQQLDQFLYNTLAMVSRQAGEQITPLGERFSISLNHLQDSKSFLAMRLSTIANAQSEALQETLLNTWAPKARDLQRDVFPIMTYEDYIQLPTEQQKLGLVIYAPSSLTVMPPQGFRMNSLYVIAKGLDKIVQTMGSKPSEAQEQLVADFNQLKDVLQRSGFMGYSGGAFALGPEFAQDFIFEQEDYFQNVLAASREDFTVHGTKRYAVLEFTDVEQRILALNKIETRMHEDLLKWRDDYRAAQLKMKGSSPFDVPPPTHNVFWNNFKLSFVKYFRGDERKILHWGLDLSGGKTVQIELRDQNGRLVKDEVDIKQAINELYTRVNKMGVSEVSIRQEGNYITLDFPGSQNLSAAELIKASTMYFHVVNEKFTPNNATLSDSVNRFLQEIWNEAVITNRKNNEDINSIAWQHLYGESANLENPSPRSEAARVLFANGLRLANPQDTTVTSYFNDSVSKIAVFRGADFTDWQGQTHPLLIVFRNYALEGSNLDEVHAAYDPSKGNYLSFKVKGSQTAKSGEKFNARDELHSWTSQFAREKIEGTPNEVFSHGKGWRMAVILNGTIVSAPTLDSPLRDNAMISGSFTQREANQLEADLKAGSLSFTPRILSEKNVSPELGAHERTLGIIATILALCLVVGAMVGYYRFAGAVACVAVFVNLLIMWATLQNLNATLTLATIAGMILTLGMAVDANVLVFERVREEFAQSGRIASAIHAGYKKAYTAIVDSNLTTLIAALILLNFDSGPIKGFAVTLIIGIISSMFTALFLTRYFFAGWVQKSANKKLNMRNFISSTRFDFLKYTRVTMIVSTVIVLVGGAFFFAQKESMVGMDFTGGYALTVELEPSSENQYRQKVEQALVASGANSQEFQIRELTPSNHIRLFLSKNLTQKNRPFYRMPVEIEGKVGSYSYESNPKIVWVVNALQSKGLSVTPQSLDHLEANWTEVSGQMSSTMRNHAIAGLILALICIMIYITFRFEFKYAISATICLIHDLIFTVAVMAILHGLGVPVQIDLITITALMTIIGYSLNDTIIVFDRIREDLRVLRKSPFPVIINHALNVTLSRTLMTSGTTLLVLIPLVALGGSTIFGFALVMMIGVIFGTLSSLFIAAPLMQYFHGREQRKSVTVIVE